MEPTLDVGAGFRALSAFANDNVRYCAVRALTTAVAVTSRDDERYLSGKQVRQRYGNISRMTLFRWQHDPAKDFPQPVYLSEHPYWRLSDLVAWEQSRSQREAA